MAKSKIPSKELEQERSEGPGEFAKQRTIVLGKLCRR